MSTSTPPPAGHDSDAAPQSIPYQLASPAVTVAGVHPKLMAFVEYLALVHRMLFNKPLVITSGKDSVHVASSLHGKGLAVDFRTKDLDPEETMLLLALLAYAAPANKIAVFDERALAGEEHIHVEYHGA
jgi:hypothetical protein